MQGTTSTATKVSRGEFKLVQQPKRLVLGLFGPYQGYRFSEAKLLETKEVGRVQLYK